MASHALTRRRVPPNVKFEIDDVEQEWAYPFKFDYVVSRYMAGSIADWPRLAELTYEYVGIRTFTYLPIYLTILN